MLSRAQKEDQVAELKDKFGRATSVYVAAYCGLDVESVNSLRRRIHNEGAGEYEYRVMKNSVLRRAADGSVFEGVTEHFQGPTVIALSYGDPVGLAKILTQFQKEHEVFELKAGVLDGKAITPAQIGTIATLPSLESLRGTIVGLIVAPATKLVRLAAAPAAQIARLAEARRKQLEEAG